MKLLGGLLASLEEISLSGTSCLSRLLSVLGENALSLGVQDNLETVLIKERDSLGSLGGLTDYVVERRIGDDPTVLER
jgi:hypothetical protein